jgi:hypothetical protein
MAYVAMQEHLKNPPNGGAVSGEAAQKMRDDFEPDVTNGFIASGHL